MIRCLICEGILPSSEFLRGGPVCKVCVGRLKSERNVEYAPPARFTVKDALVNLVIAIRRRAEDDERGGAVLALDVKYGGPLSAWRHNWVDSDPWAAIWDMMESDGASLSLSGSNTARSQGGYRG